MGGLEYCARQLETVEMEMGNRKWNWKMKTATCMLGIYIDKLSAKTTWDLGKSYIHTHRNDLTLLAVPGTEMCTPQKLMVYPL